MQQSANDEIMLADVEKEEVTDWSNHGGGSPPFAFTKTYILKNSLVHGLK